MDLCVIEILIRKFCCNTDQIGMKWNFSIKRFSGLKYQNCTLNVGLFEKKKSNGTHSYCLIFKNLTCVFSFQYFLNFLLIFCTVPNVRDHFVQNSFFHLHVFYKRRFLQINKDTPPPLHQTSEENSKLRNLDIQCSIFKSVTGCRFFISIHVSLFICKSDNSILFINTTNTHHLQILKRDETG